MRSYFLLAAFALIMMMTQAAHADTEGIGWIPTWKQAIAEAYKSHKPILLISAAPACGGVPGIW
jgi:hypothetical protein